MGCPAAFSSSIKCVTEAEISLSGFSRWAQALA